MQQRKSHDEGFFLTSEFWVEIFCFRDGSLVWLGFKMCFGSRTKMLWNCRKAALLFFFPLRLCSGDPQFARVGCRSCSGGKLGPSVSMMIGGLGLISCVGWQRIWISIRIRTEKDLAMSNWVWNKLYHPHIWPLFSSRTFPRNVSEGLVSHSKNLFASQILSVLRSCLLELW